MGGCLGLGVLARNAIGQCWFIRVLQILFLARTLHLLEGPDQAENLQF